MTALPSFVELMASLGLDQTARPRHQSPSSSPPSPQVPSFSASSRTKTKSSQSLKDTTSRQRHTRYSPYSPAVSTSRRGSVSSMSSASSDNERSSLSAYSPTSSPRLGRRISNLTINVYGSISDLAVNTPISTYVRRKTPGASPTSPTFPQDSRDSRPMTPIPVTIPILPPLLPNSASTESFPNTPCDSEIPSREWGSSILGNSRLAKDLRPFKRHVGVRISSPSRSIEFNGQPSRRLSLANIA